MSEQTTAGSIHSFVLNSALALIASILLFVSPTLAGLPELYTQPSLQSPVRGEADDLLMIPGHGFADGAIVVYEALNDTTLALQEPVAVPSVSTSTEGLADVVSCESERLIVRLPSAIASGQSYALWVKNPGQPWSDGIRINDARPLWISPDRAFETVSLASLPRELKVIGRNLQPAPTAPGGKTRVRLLGPETHLLEALAATNPSLDHYVARVELPAPLEPGTHQVELSRDGASWVPVEPTLEVLDDPPPFPTVSVADFGLPGDPCLPDDGIDDARCIQEASDAAAGFAGGATVTFPTGRWDLRLPPGTSGPDLAHGIVIHRGVNLEGQGLATRVLRTEDWGWVPGICEEGLDANGDGKEDSPCVHAVFTLQGDNWVRGLHFDDAFPDRDFRTVYLQLGKRPWWTTPDDPTLIENIAIYDNRMTNMYIGIGDGNFPMSRIYIVDNELEAYRDDVLLGGNSNRRSTRFNLEDSVIAYNDFYPGQYYAPEIVQGVIGSQIGGSRHLDLSHNTLHRLDLDEECAGLPGGCGWRAAHFWHMNNNHEMMLVSRNHAECTSDKAGDGEFVAFDNNQNEPGFQSARTLIEATPSTVRVQGPWFRTGTEETGDLDYYGEHWVQIGEGRGLGQTRKIVSCCCGEACATPEESACGAPCASEIVITVSPDWDVVPEPGRGRITVLREYWQVYVVDNMVDIRGCEKDNPTQPRAGVIFLHGNTADSAVEGNTQYETDGIWLASAYSVDSYDPEREVAFTSWARLQYFNEVRGNTILGEYNFNDCLPDECPMICCNRWCCPPDGISCMVDDYCAGQECCSEETCCAPETSWSGIELRYGQYPLSDGPVLGYGVSVSHNTVENADALRSGAIAVDRGWWPPPTPDLPLWKGVTIHHNDIRAVERLDDEGECLPFDVYHRDGGAGVHIQEAFTHGAVLYDNTFDDVCYPIQDGGVETLVLGACPSESECNAGFGCEATSECFFTDTELDACLRPDDSVFKCPAYHRMQTRRCFCTGPTCPMFDEHLVCVPEPWLPPCPDESECSAGAGCTATSGCFFDDTDEPACRRSDQTVFGCPDGETIHVRRCFCTGPTCPLHDEHLVCQAGDAPPLPSAPGEVTRLTMAKSATTEGNLTLTWLPSCLSGVLDYGIYEGLIGSWNSHEPIDCTDDDGDLVEEVSPSGSDAYYLVVPNNVDDDGSFGRDWDGNEREVGAVSCRLSQDLEPCP